MLRDLQSSVINVNGQCKASAQMVRGTFVQINEVAKTFAITSSVTDAFVVDKDMTITKASAMGEPYSDYDTEQETILVNEFAGLIPLQKGVRKATSEYTVSDAEAVADLYLTIVAGKLVTSGTLGATPTSIKSLGFITDNGHKLLGFRIV
jgi:hypothetical protein